MEQIERVKKITNAWEPELCRRSVNREARVNMEIYHEGAAEPERHKTSMARAVEYIRSMAAVMDIKALLRDDLEAMNVYMNEVTQEVFSSFDSGTKPSRNAPERFYHGFVLGLLVDLQGKYLITSNRESGFGRYDVMLEPKNLEEDDAIIYIHIRRREKKEQAVAINKALSLD